MNLELVLLSMGWHLKPLKNKERGNLQGKRIREWSRWQSSRTWSSPSPRNISKIHLYVERSSQNIYWTLEEDLRLWKDQENLHVTGYKKTLKKKKELGQKLCPCETAVKEERFLYLEKPPHHQEDSLGQKGSFWASEESMAAYLWQPQQTENYTDGAAALHSPAWHACLPVLEGDGCWNLGFRDQTWGKDWGWLCWDRWREWESYETVAGGYTKRKPGPPYTPVTIVWRAWKEWGTDCSLSLHAKRGQDTAFIGSRGGCQEWSQATTVSFLDSRSGHKLYPFPLHAQGCGWTATTENPRSGH